LVFERVGQHASRWAAICSVAAEVNVSGETLGKWVRQAEVDAGARVGASSEDTEELRRLRRENVELRRANEILKASSVFFVRELDPRLPRAATWSNASVRWRLRNLKSRIGNDSRRWVRATQQSRRT
jgi:transposase